MISTQPALIPEKGKNQLESNILAIRAYVSTELCLLVAFLTEKQPTQEHDVGAFRDTPSGKRRAIQDRLTP